MKTILTLSLFVLALSLTAQTRRIAHRAHSGAKSERYTSTDGSYGEMRPRKVKVHLESGRDTMVYEWDSIATPNYRYWETDTMPRAQFRPRDPEKEDIREMGMVTGRLIVRAGPN